jgi:antitoxin component YwqK of YwqJK toxin-antitoxin module
LYELTVNYPGSAPLTMRNLFSILIIALLANTVSAQSPILRNGLYTDLDGKAFTGSAIMEDLTANPIQKQYIEVENGLLHGQIKYFHSKGYVEEVGQYVSGKKEGAWIQYAPSGQKLGEAYYKDGLKNGIWTVWDEQGVKRYHMVYSMGKKVDTWKMWDSNAVLVSERVYNE